MEYSRFADSFEATKKQIELDADRAAKEEKREKAKAAKLREFKEKQAALKAGKKKAKKASKTTDESTDDPNDSTGGGADDQDDNGAPASMFDSMMSSLQAGEAFAKRRGKGSAIKKKASAIEMD